MSVESEKYFEDNIKPFFYQYREQMLWRMDIAAYEDVKANALLLYARISSKDNPMPPAPYDPFSDQVIEDFRKWMIMEGITTGGS